MLHLLGIDHERLTYKFQGLEQRLTAEQTIAWWDARPQAWMAESATLRDGLYPAAGEQPVSLGYTYQYQHLPAVEARLLQSGVRIAAYLDRLFH